MTRTPFAALATAAVLVLTSACGGSSDSASKSSDFTSQSADAIVAAAQADMRALDSMSFSGSMTSSGQEVTIDMQVASGGDCTGTIGVAGGSAEILGVDGSTWFRPDEAFWNASAGAQAALIIATVGDKWVLLPPGDASFGQFCDLDQFLGQIFTDDSTDTGTYTKGKTAEVDGETTIVVSKDDPQGGPSDGYIQVDGDHYLVKLEKTGEDAGTISFSDFDAAVSMTAPTDAEVIDLSSLGG